MEGGTYTMKILILGAGYSGKAIGRAFKEAGAEVYGTTRSPEKFEGLEQAGITPLLFDGHEMSDALRAAAAEATHLVQSIAPGRDGDPLLRLLGGAGGDIRQAMPKLEWISYLSTVGVYGDHDGAWVDESTPCRPVSVRSVERVEAEQGWEALAKAASLPLAVLRLSGIYGPGRNGLINLSNGTARRLVKKDQVFNRIRVEDIASAALFLAERGASGIFNVTDDEPAPPQDVVTEAARLMDVPAPPEQPFETAELSPMARSFYGENKRVSNARIRSLGFSFLYPDYRISLLQMWQSGTWNQTL